MATITDSATLAGATAGAGGTVTYSLYSPAARAVDSCVPGNQVSIVTVAVIGGNVANGTFTGVAAGDYELQAVYTGDANNNGAISACGEESFTVTQATPTLATALSAGTAHIGTPVTDSATLAAATTNAGGTVTYTVYTNNTCTTPATSQINAQPPAVTVTGAVVPDSAPVTFLAAGSYYWEATYSGDINNSATASVCTSEPITITNNSTGITTLLSAFKAAIGTPVTDSATLIEPPPMRGAR